MPWKYVLFQTSHGHGGAAELRDGEAVSPCSLLPGRDPCHGEGSSEVPGHKDQT